MLQAYHMIDGAGCRVVELRYASMGVCAMALPPPLLPSAVRHRLMNDKDLVCTLRSDKEMLSDMYKAFFDAATAVLTKLQLAAVGWGASEATCLVQVMPSLTRLTEIDISQNCFDGRAASTLAEALSDHSSITSLRFNKNPAVKGHAAITLARAVVAMPSLVTFSEMPVQKLRADTIESLCLRWRGLGATEGYVLAFILPQCTRLKELDLRSNMEITDAAEALAEAVLAVKDLQSFAQLPMLSLRQNSLISLDVSYTPPHVLLGEEKKKEAERQAAGSGDDPPHGRAG